MKTKELIESLLGRFEGKNGYSVFYKTEPDFTAPDSVFINRDYKMLGSINADGLEGVYYNMQGEIWSPEGEARPIIRELNLKHTSMSVGDVIRDDHTGVYYIVDVMGFKKVGLYR